MRNRTREAAIGKAMRLVRNMRPGDILISPVSPKLRAASCGPLMANWWRGDARKAWGEVPPEVRGRLNRAEGVVVERAMRAHAPKPEVPEPEVGEIILELT